MTSRKVRPATRGGAGQSLDSFGSRAASNDPQITQTVESLQHRRAVWRRFRLPLTMAAGLAILAFEEARQL